jgi:hypothetical protein
MAADGQDTAIADRQRLDDGLGGVERDDLAAEEHGIRYRRGIGRETPVRRNENRKAEQVKLLHGVALSRM